MITPATLALTANRHAPFVYAIQINDIDLTGAVLDMHVRLDFGTPGDPLIDLSPQTAGTQGLSKVIAGGNTTLTIQIDEAALEGLPAPAEVGDDLVLAYDLQITPSGGTKAVWFRGSFTVRAGVTP